LAEIVEIETSESTTSIVEVIQPPATTIEVVTGGQVGPPGPQGEPGAATTPVIVLTQAEYDALSSPDPESLYVIISP
jgi:hypothetical protein